MSRRRRLAPAALALLVGGCMPTAATSQGREIGTLYQVFLIAAIVVAVIVFGLTTWAVIRYRRRDDELPHQQPGDFRVEAVWTAIPLLTVLILFVLTVRTLDVVQARGDGGIDLQVTAFRWQWQATYPEGGVTLFGGIGQPLQIVLPVGESIHVTLSSVDVDHSFYVPGFLFKRDAIPGRPSTFDLRIEQAGTYGGACAEFCGVQHDQMLFSIKAVSAAEFQAWLTTQSSASPSASPSAASPSAASPSAASPSVVSPSPASLSAVSPSPSGS
jgi:cytochrome c oxidase subunit 2